MVEVRFHVPRQWRDDLAVGAKEQAISMADLLRLIVRQFLRGRYDDAAQKALS